MDKKPAKFAVYMLYFISLGILLGLGSWQLSRGFEKRDLELKIKHNAEIEVQLVDKTQDWKQLNYQNIKISGQWLPNKLFLLDNRINRGVIGYEVLVPFMLEKDQTIVLVNLGWVSRENRLNIPERVAAKTIEIEGQIFLPDKGFTLGPPYTDQSSWPVIIQYFEAIALSNALNKTISPAVLVINPDNDIALTRIWKPYVIDAKKHYGYALQWWSLAIVLLVFGIIWRKNEQYIN